MIILEKSRLTNRTYAGMSGIIALFILATAVALPAQTFTNLLNFNGTDGSNPNSMPFVQGRDGDFYGTTSYGGIHDGCGLGYYGCGTVFKISASGQLTTLYSFCAQANCTDGVSPVAGLVQGADGNFYGTTISGGANCVSMGGCGTLFKITPKGKLTTLYNFCVQANCTDGNGPSTLIQAANGDFYGTTHSGGGTCFVGFSCGTIFKITPAGTLTSLYSFCSVSNCSDGAFPAGMIQATDGNFYGTTGNGGINSDACKWGCGTAFKITPVGKLTTLHEFCSQSSCLDGFYPNAGLIQASDGNLYGTTFYGGPTWGTIFKINPAGKLTTFYNFCSQFGCTDGSMPAAGLIQASDGNFYGTTGAGGDGGCAGLGCGTVFEITPDAAITTLYEFYNLLGADGVYPQAALMQATNGIFYGTTPLGGEVCGPDGQTCGTVFSISNALGPFVSLPQASGKVGQTGAILGQGLTGTTSVSVNSTPASFTVVSDTYIRVTVPTGATTGLVTVETPSGTLTSNVPFHVIP
jgi:uncharacterized repeat protein (TIGR03803 family)